MAFPNSALSAGNWLECLKGTSGEVFDLNNAGIKIALYDNTYNNTTYSLTSSTPRNKSSVTAGEEDGTGYTTNMPTLTASLNVTATGVITWTLGANPVWSGSNTFDSVYGCLFWDDTPTNNPIICGIKFDAPGSCSAGTFTVDLSDSPSSFTVFTIDAAPND